MKKIILIVVGSLLLHYANAQLCSQNWVVNGNFENGNAGFGSGLIFDCNPILAAGEYCVTTDASQLNGNWLQIQSQDPGTFYYAADGVSIGCPVVAWSQSINVAPGSTYTFCFWGINLDVAALVNPVLSGNILNGNATLATVNTGPLAQGVGWTQFCINNWVAPPGVLSVTLEIRQENCAAVGGYDFGIDNIIFMGPYTYNIDITSVPCTGGACDGSATATALDPAVAPVTYVWNTNPVTNGPTITNQCAGTYTVTATDDNGCVAMENVTIGPACPSCPQVQNPTPQGPTIPDQSCWWSTGGNSNATVGLLNKLGTTNNQTPLRIVTNDLERIRINGNDGFVGINTTNPTNRLEINSAITGKSGLRFHEMDELSNALTSNVSNTVLSVDGSGDVILVQDQLGTGGLSNQCMQQNFVTMDDGAGNLLCSDIFNDNNSHVGVNTNTINSAQPLYYGFQNAGTGLFSATPPAAPYCTYNGNPPYPLMVQTNDVNHRYYGLAILANSNTMPCVGAPCPPLDHLKLYVDNSGTSFIETLGRPTVFRYGGCYGYNTSGDQMAIVPRDNNIVIKKDFVANPPIFNSINRPKLYSELNNVDGDFSAYAIWGNNTSSSTSAWHHNIGVIGTATGAAGGVFDNPNVGGRFLATGNARTNIGVWGVSPGTQSFNVQGNWAGYFDGDVRINGTAYATTWGPSDKRYKDDIQILTSALEKISMLNGYTYNFRASEFPEKRFSTARMAGLIAQEMKEVIPESVQEMNDGYLAVNYDGVVALLVEAVKEQKEIIERDKADVKELKEKITELESVLAQCCSAFEDQNLRSTESDNASLGQNVPNPFNENTEIGYYLPSVVKSSSINVYTIDGQKLQTFDSLVKGRSSVSISSGILAPGAYLYNLVADGKQIDSKWMIVTK